MAKVLTAARVRVPPANEADYLATLRELCQFADARGQRIWVFRNAKDPQLFTEFSESPTEMSHRAQASRLPEEIKLERRLQGLGAYAPDAWELWTEGPPTAAGEAEGGRVARRTRVVGGQTWGVDPSGRGTVYDKDEVGLIFQRGTGAERN